MEDPKTPSNNGLINIEKILGYILLAPPLISVLFFLISVFSEYDSDKNQVVQLGNLSPNWTGKIRIDYDTDRGGGGGGGYMSAAPIYLGLMAIAGALLVSKNSNRKAGG